MKHILCVVALAIACASCNQTTAGIPEARAEASVRKACPAFRTGPFTSDAARTYGVEQITTFRNTTNFNCRCLVKSADQAPACSQVRRFELGKIEEG